MKKCLLGSHKLVVSTLYWLLTGVTKQYRDNLCSLYFKPFAILNLFVFKVY